MLQAANRAGVATLSARRAIFENHDHIATRFSFFRRWNRNDREFPGNAIAMSCRRVIEFRSPPRRAEKEARAFVAIDVSAGPRPALSSRLWAVRALGAPRQHLSPRVQRSATTQWQSPSLVVARKRTGAARPRTPAANFDHIFMLKRKKGNRSWRKRTDTLHGCQPGRSKCILDSQVDHGALRQVHCQAPRECSLPNSTVKRAAEFIATVDGQRDSLRA